MGRTKRSIINILVSITNKILVTLLPFAIRTIMIQTIGIEYLGVDSLFASVLSMLSLSELGFSSAIVYSLYKPIADGDNEKVKGLLCFYKTVYRIVGFIIISVGLLLLPNLQWFIAKGTSYPGDINIRVVYLILLFNTAISYLLFSYKSAVLVASMRNDLDSIIETIRSIVSHGLQIIVLLLFKQYYLYIVVLPIVTIANNLTRAIIIDKKFPHYVGIGTLSKEDKKGILTRVGALIGNKLGGAVFTSVDSIVISKYLGLIVLAKYTNYYTIFAAIFAIETTAYTAIQSTVGNSLVSNSAENNYTLFKDIFNITIVISMVCVSCFIALYQPFISLWVGEDNLLGIEIPILLSLYYFVKSTRKTLFTFYEAAGLWKADFLKPYVSVAVNLVTNIILVQIIGLPGVIISSILALVIVEMPWEASVFFRRCFNKSANEYGLLILKAILFSGIAFGITYYVCLSLPYGVFGIIIRLSTALAVCATISFVMLKYTNGGKQVLQRFKFLLANHSFGFHS